MALPLKHSGGSIQDPNGHRLPPAPAHSLTHSPPSPSLSPRYLRPTKIRRSSLSHKYASANAEAIDTSVPPFLGSPSGFIRSSSFQQQAAIPNIETPCVAVAQGDTTQMCMCDHDVDGQDDYSTVDNVSASPIDYPDHYVSTDSQRNYESLWRPEEWQTFTPIFDHNSPAVSNPLEPVTPFGDLVDRALGESPASVIHSDPVMENDPPAEGEEFESRPENQAHWHAGSTAEQTYAHQRENASGAAASTNFEANDATFTAGGNIEAGTRNLTGNGNSLTETTYHVHITQVTQQESSTLEPLALGMAGSFLLSVFPAVRQIETYTTSEPRSLLLSSSQGEPTSTSGAKPSYMGEYTSRSLAAAKTAMPTLSAAVHMSKLLFPKASKKWKKTRRNVKRVGVTLGFLSLVTLVASRD